MEEQKTTLQEPESNQAELASQEIIVNPPEIKKKKKIIMAGCISALAVILAVILVVTYTNSPIRHFDRALNDNDNMTAKALYSTNADNEKFANKAQAVVEEYIQKNVNAYCEGGIEYKAAKQRISDLSWCQGIAETRTDALIKIGDVQTSKKSYEEAENALKKENFGSAISGFKKVIEDDKQNYASAQDKISETAEAWCQSAINEANTSLAKNDAVQAYIQLTDVSKEFRNDQLNNLLKDTTAKAQESVATQLQEKIGSNEYKDAFIATKSIPEELVNDKITNLKAEASNGLLEQAEQKASAGDYKAAIALLTDGENSLDGSFERVISDYQKKQDEKTLLSLKGYFTIRYDSIDKEYNIVPNGLSTKGIDIGYNRNIEPWMKVQNGSPTFLLYLGFRQDDWIFMEEIIIDCDGHQFKLKVDYWDRITDISWGSIAEAAGFMHVEKDVLGYLSGESRAIDVEPIVTAMNTAEKVSVRFKGDGYKDVTIPKSQVEQFNGFWIAYNILKDNPDLISVIA